MTRQRKGFLFRRGQVYYMAVQVAGKRVVRTTGMKSKREAAEAMREFLRPLALGNEAEVLASIAGAISGRKAELAAWEDKAHPPLPIAQAWHAYETAANRPDSGARTLEDYHGYFEAFARWIGQGHPSAVALRNVTKEMANAYAAHLVKRGLSANSYNKHLRFLELLFRVLAEPGRVVANPWQGMKRKVVVAEGRREMTLDELRTVCGNATGEMRVLLAVGLFCGLRLKDAALLQWGEVDLQRGVIRKVPAKTARRKPRPVVIPIHASLADMLAETPAPARRGDVLPETAAAYRTKRDSLVRGIQAHFEKSGIETLEPGTGRGTGKRAVVRVGFHSLRHSFVSLCREAGAPLSVVESIAGHSNPTMTRLYSHTSEAAARAAVALLPSVTGDPPAAAEPVRLVDVAKVHSLAARLNGRTWRKVLAELEAM